MYVISPSPHPRPSYRACAALMVRPAPNPNRLDASCCIVDVVKGGDARRFTSFSETSATRNEPADVRIAAAHSSACARDAGSALPSFRPRTCVSSATNESSRWSETFSVDERTFAVTLQRSSFTKRSISNSRSHTSRSATDCTRPALSRSALGIFRQRTPERLNPKR